MTLKLRLTIAVSIAVFLVALVSTVGSLHSQRQAENRFEEVTTQSKTVLWKKIIASQLAEMESGTAGLTRDRESLDALRDNNRSVLDTAMRTTYNRLSTSKVITKLQVVDLTGEVVFSAPEPYTGKTRKSLVSRALSESKNTGGLERDDDGKLVVEYVFPLFSRGVMIGAGIFSRDLVGAVADFQNNDQSILFILDSSGDLELAIDEQKIKDLGIAIENVKNPFFKRIDRGDVSFAVIGTPINDAENTGVAMLISVKDYTRSYHAQDRSNLFSMLLMLLGLPAICFGIYMFVSVSFGPMNELVRGMQAIADGDLTHVFPVKSRDEVGLLQEVMNKMTTTLREMIANISQSSVKLSASAQTLANITVKSNEGTKRQQAEAEQVATAANELAATIQEVSHSTQLTADASLKASESARVGRQVVTRTIDTINNLAKEVQQAAVVIDQLKDSTQGIGVVIDVIRGIAEQTNLLALNAAIEAARAGEQGRGFAVVADEVRTLASRTQKSTQEINAIIKRLQDGSHAAVKAMQESQTRATAGVDQAANTGAALEEIATSVETISSMAAQIAAASIEQSTAAEEIDRNVTSISAVVEQNAHSNEQIFVASGELAKLATDLHLAIQRFKT